MESKASHKPERTQVVRLDVGLHSMQPIATEDKGQDRCQRFPHVTLARKGNADLIPKVRTAELAPDDLTELNRSHDGAVRAAHDKPALVLRTCTVP